MYNNKNVYYDFTPQISNNTLGDREKIAKIGSMEWDDSN